MKMKAAIFHGIRDVRLEEVEVPKIGPGEVLVRVRAALTCGTDKKMYLRGYHLGKPPFVFGHEFALPLATAVFTAKWEGKVCVIIYL